MPPASSRNLSRRLLFLPLLTLLVLAPGPAPGTTVQQAEEGSKHPDRPPAVLEEEPGVAPSLTAAGESEDPDATRTGSPQAAGGEAGGTPGTTTEQDNSPGGSSDADKVRAEAGKGEDKAPDSPYSQEAMKLWPPVHSLVTATFGERRASIVPLLSDEPIRTRAHGGVDLRGHLGWAVRSLENGVVLAAGPAGNAGIAVKIRQDNGKTVSYAHLGEALVKKGDKVVRGQHIGRVGCTGRTTGAHLHITVRDGQDRRTDPLKEIQGLWQIYDPPLEDLKGPIQAQACTGTLRGMGGVRGGPNKRLEGQKRYLRMRKALLENKYKVPDDIEAWEKRNR